MGQLRFGLLARQEWKLIRMSSDMNGIRRLATIAALIATSLAVPAQAEMIPGYPDVIICSTAGSKFVLRLEKVSADGSAAYSANVTSGVAVVSPEGVFNRPGQNDCHGKTLDQLKRDGQTRDLTK